MKAMHSGFVKVLTVLICIGAIAAGMISLQRNHVETAARTVEMVYDYNNIIDSASVEKKTPDELFSLYKQSGITSLAVYDETPEKLVNHNYLKVYRGSDFAFRNPSEAGRIDKDKIYIQQGSEDNSAEYFGEVKEHLNAFLRPEDLEEHQIAGTDTLEVNGAYDKFMTMPLGIFKQSIKNAAAKGFYVVVRPSNIPHVTQDDVQLFLDAVSSSDKVSAVIFQGKEALGYKSQLKYLAGGLQRLKIPVVLIEAQNQLGFERQDGILDLARYMDYDVVRLYAMSKDELIKISPDEAASRFYISDIERNIRMNLFPSYKFAADGKTLSETNAEYISDVKQRLEEHGFSVGKASIMEPYFPNSIVRAIAMAGAASLCVLAFVLIFPAAFKFGYVIEIAVLLLTQGLFWLTHSVLPLQMLALGCAVCTPVVVVSLFLEYCIKQKNKAFSEIGWGRLFVESVAILWIAGILSLIGALFISGLLGDIRFLLEMQIFRGVKVTFLLPIILVSIIYIQKFPFFGHVVASDRDFVQFVKKFCSVQIKLGLLAGLGILAIVGYVFIGRSGNNGAPIPAFEIALRRFLEDTMYARPREKEFLFGHPAILLSLAALYRKWPQILHYLLILAVTIGQGSMVETFAHMRSPFILSFIRGLDGLAAGTLSMVAALLGVMILARITKFFGERYGKL